MIHHQGDGYLLAHSLFDAAPQLDGHQRIHAEVEESRVLADLRGVDARHLCYRVAQVVGQKLPALLHRSIGEPLDQLGLPGRRCRQRGRRQLGRHLALQLRQECPPARLLVERQEAGPVDPGHHALCRTKPPRHRPDPPVHRRVTTSATPRLIQSRTGLRVGHARRPGAEIDADPRDALLAQAPGQPVEEGVGRAVGGLTESAPYRGDRGGAEEEVELQVSRCFAQMPSTPDLPGEDAIDFGVVQVAQRGGTDLARGMDDAGQRR